MQKGELELAHDRYAELKRRHDALRKDHDELVEAVRQAAREERRLAEAAAAAPRARRQPAADGARAAGGEGRGRGRRGVAAHAAHARVREHLESGERSRNTPSRSPRESARASSRVQAIPTSMPGPPGATAVGELGPERRGVRRRELGQLLEVPVLELAELAERLPLLREVRAPRARAPAASSSAAATRPGRRPGRGGGAGSPPPRGRGRRATPWRCRRTRRGAPRAPAPFRRAILPAWTNSSFPATRESPGRHWSASGRELRAGAAPRAASARSSGSSISNSAKSGGPSPSPAMRHAPAVGMRPHPTTPPRHVDLDRPACHVRDPDAEGPAAARPRGAPPQGRGARLLARDPGAVRRRLRRQGRGGHPQVRAGQGGSPRARDPGPLGRRRRGPPRRLPHRQGRVLPPRSEAAAGGSRPAVPRRVGGPRERHLPLRARPRPRPEQALLRRPLPGRVRGGGGGRAPPLLRGRRPRPRPRGGGGSAGGALPRGRSQEAGPPRLPGRGAARADRARRRPLRALPAGRRLVRRGLLPDAERDPDLPRRADRVGRS